MDKFIESHIVSNQHKTALLQLLDRLYQCRLRSYYHSTKFLFKPQEIMIINNVFPLCHLISTT